MIKFAADVFANYWTAVTILAPEMLKGLLVLTPALVLMAIVAWLNKGSDLI